MNDIIHKIKGYLGYEVPIQIEGQGLYYNYKTLDEFVNEFYLDCINKISQNVVKLKLRPLDSLTDEELVEILGYIGIFRNYAIRKIKKGEKFNLFNEEKHDLLNNVKVVEFFHKNHIDYQDLIGQGLAVELDQLIIKGE